MVNITFDFDIAGPDEEPLALALGCEQAELEAKLQGHAKAALHEYVEAYLGRRSFTRGTDILEHRLALLIREVFADRVPKEGEVALLFQAAPAASRTLLRNTLSKYRYMLRDQTKASAKTVLEKAKWVDNNNKVQLEIVSPLLLDSLNERLREKDPAKKKVALVADSVATYETSGPAYELLCAEFGADEAAKP